RCFDGNASLDDLIADLADAFGADPDIVANDVVQLSRALGRSGLLEGVTAQLALGRMSGDGYEPAGLPRGSEVPSFSRRDLDGHAAVAGGRRSRSVSRPRHAVRLSRRRARPDRLGAGGRREPGACAGASSGRSEGE